MMGSSFILLLTNKMAASPRSGSTPGIRVACPPISQRLGTSAFDPRITHTRFQRSPAVPLYRKRGRQLQWPPSKPLMQPCRSCRSRGRREGQLARDLRERRHRVLELRRAVRGRDLYADACLSLRYHGIRKPNDVDALVEQARGHVLREVGVVEHDGDDRVFARAHIEAGELHAFTKVGGVLTQSLTQRLAARHELQRLEAARDQCGRERKKKEIGP